MRFGLRTLLVGLTCLCLCLGMHVHNVNKQAAAVRQVLAHDGGEIRYDYEFDKQLRRPSGRTSPYPPWLLRTLGYDFFHEVWSVRTHHKEHATGFHDLRWLEVRDSSVGDKDVREFVGNSNLRGLQLTLSRSISANTGYATVGKKAPSSTLVTDKGVNCLNGLPHLRYLSIRTDHLTDESLRLLSTITTLDWLNLGDNQFTSDGLRHLVALRNLAVLDLEGDKSYTSKIDDDAIEHLSNLSALTKLDLRYTAISNNGLDRLKVALPKCKIRDPW